MSDPYEFIPGYVSPLTDKQHATLGRIAVLWGQIEHFIEEIIPIVTSLTKEQLDAIGTTSKPIGAKNDFLLASAKRISDAYTKT